MNEINIEQCSTDADELREIAEYFDARYKTTNGNFLRAVATRHEVLASAYNTAAANVREWQAETIELREVYRHGYRPELHEAICCECGFEASHPIHHQL